MYVKGNFLNFFITLPLIVAFDFYVLSNGKLDQAHTLEELPDAKITFLTVVFCALIDDFIFTLMHCVLHKPPLYALLHKQHHKLTDTNILGNHYTHPIEFAILTTCTIAGPKILGMRCHYWTSWTWYLVRFWQGIEEHCGYDFSFSPMSVLPFSGHPEYHQWHHFKNCGNYSLFFTYVDTLLGTN